MAIKVGYFEDQKPEHYKEGPFVMVNATGWRIEMKSNGKCSTLAICNNNVSEYCKKNNILEAFNKTDDEQKCARAVDLLNSAFNNKELVL